ncbi:hypothetical protein DFJ58DRAFT_850877 [Suillus subalutaceus]|uniref:uncharacterized protein n=1 Tax=Suillus subalutaceus TaxID=48586 RepID=UPI001B879F63|nr:uncharacterized protein DFJ58DRAFT_850877 [Suillus subalutaceus]KAG1877626.1 hypothetical protein DFJ58DRAFT_850877 [Suillus subalutaceus]
MGSSASKTARTLPKEKSSWAGARTPLKQDSAQEIRRPRPLAFENKTDAVEADGKDPQFMSKLSQLGPVRVDHHMRSVRPVRNLVLDSSQADYVQQMHRSRLQSEVEALPSHSTQNRLLASSLSELLEARKTVKSQAELQALAEQYHIDVTQLDKLAKFINTPSIDESTIVRSTNQDGEETLTMMASWVTQNLKP